MTVLEVANDLQAQIPEAVYVEATGDGRHYIVTPFVYADGDQPVVAIVQDGDAWLLSDLGTALFRFDYDRLYGSPFNERRIDAILSDAGVARRDDELTKPLLPDAYADAVFIFVHALLKIDELKDVSDAVPSVVVPERLPQSTAEGFAITFRMMGESETEVLTLDPPTPPGPARRPRFKTEVFNLVGEVLPMERVTRNWCDPLWDHRRQYPVDFKINALAKPLFVHALSNNNHAKDATITIYRFHDEKVEGQHIAIFRDERSVGVNVKAKLDAVCDRIFTDLEVQGAVIREFLQRETESRSANC
jgi:hypothetical protein